MFWPMLSSTARGFWRFQWRPVEVGARMLYSWWGRFLADPGPRMGSAPMNNPRSTVYAVFDGRLGGRGEQAWHHTAQQRVQGCYAKNSETYGEVVAKPQQLVGIVADKPSSFPNPSFPVRITMNQPRRICSFCVSRSMLIIYHAP
jgi:hypothetical protein